MMEHPPASVPIMSRLGVPLTPPDSAGAAQQRALAHLAAAQADYERDPSLAHTIWYGRRAAYCTQFTRAIAIFSDGIARFPEAYELYRHRGHRLISVRRFTEAAADLDCAAALAADRPVELEPDGVPNRLNQPRSSGHFNIWYHLGLARYLLGDYIAAHEAYTACLQYADNDDGLTATLDWLYMTNRRLGATDAAAALLDRVHPTMDLVEDDSYHRRLLMYKGLISPQELLAPPDDADPDAAALTVVTQGYGVGNWHLANGDTIAALAIFARILQTSSWAAFGYIAAETDVARIGAASGIL